MITIIAIIIASETGLVEPIMYWPENTPFIVGGCVWLPVRAENGDLSIVSTVERRRRTEAGFGVGIKTASIREGPRRGRWAPGKGSRGGDDTANRTTLNPIIRTLESPFLCAASPSHAVDGKLDELFTHAYPNEE